MVDIAAPKSTVLNRDRARLKVAGGYYRLIAAFNIRQQIALVKFIGMNAEYDATVPLTAARFDKDDHANPPHFALKKDPLGARGDREALGRTHWATRGISSTFS